MTNDIKLHQDHSFRCHTLVCSGPVAAHCKALIAVDVARGPLDLTLVPHDHVLLSIRFDGGTDPFARGCERSWLPQICRWRTAPYRYQTGGGCLSFFALLTPLGAVRLRCEGIANEKQPLNVPLATLLERAELVALKDALVAADGVSQRLHALGAWLEDRFNAHQSHPWQAIRTARVVQAMFAEPALGLERLASAERVCRRQLERDFRRWYATSPKQVSLIARGQAAARLGHAGQRSADIAYQLGFAHQAHLNRVIKKLFGISPPVIARSAQTALSSAFRHAARGGLVYL